MCQIVDVVYHYCGFCGNMLDRIGSCPDDAFASLCEDLCLRINNRVTEQKSLDTFCPRRVPISWSFDRNTRRGRLTLEGMAKMIRLVSVPVNPLPASISMWRVHEVDGDGLIGDEEVQDLIGSF
jgi:hypothetical protein